jgi:hypothetical protein
VAASPEERPKIRSPQDVYNLLGPALRDEKREHFVALLLDTKGGVLRQLMSASAICRRRHRHPARSLRASRAPFGRQPDRRAQSPVRRPDALGRRRQVTRRLVEAVNCWG